MATDVSLEALRVAQWSADALGGRVDFVCCDLASGVGGCFDLIVSNPPYIPGREIATLQREVRDFEPRVPLVGGRTGTEIYGRIMSQAKKCSGRAGG